MQCHFLMVVPVLLGAAVSGQKQSGISYGGGSGKSQSFHEPEHNDHAVYNFAYNVNDEYGNNYGHNEDRNGDATTGQYFVQLPDGRLQTVSYNVNGYSGFVANVEYKGKAKFGPPAYKIGQQYGGGVSYDSAPSFEVPTFRSSSSKSAGKPIRKAGFGKKRY